AANVRKGRLRAAKGLVLPLQNLGQLGSIPLQAFEVMSQAPVALGVKRRPIVKLRHAIKVVEVVEQEGARLRDASVGDTLRFHKQVSYTARSGDTTQRGVSGVSPQATRRHGPSHSLDFDAHD